MKTATCVLCLSLVGGGIFVSTASAQPALEELERQLDRILSGRRDSPPADPGPSEPADAAPVFLGLTADNSTTRAGVEIIAVQRGGPADNAGLAEGDLVLSLNRDSIRTLDDMANALEGLNTGDRVDFEVFRSGRRIILPVTLGRRPASDAPDAVAPRAEALPAPAARPDERRASLGVRVSPVTDDARLRHDLTVRRGALISSVQEGWPADIAGLQIGDVVVGCDDRRVDNPDDLIGYLRTVRPDQEIELTFYRGDRVYRTTANLGEIAEAPPEIAAPEPPLRLGESRIFGEDRPALRRIEGVIDRLASPDRETRTEMAALQREVELLREQVKLLEQKVDDLEARLSVESP